MPGLAFLFFITALLYAAAGFGGGSTYNALLALHHVDYRILPAIALVCNIIVVAGGVWRFGAAGQIDWRRIAPWIVGSTPAALIGGLTPVSEAAFLALLGGALLVAGLHLLVPLKSQGATAREIHPALAVGGGAGLGFLAGITGIGGGIYLAPILHFARWDNPRRIAGAASLFILINSLAGLAGQTAKLRDTPMMEVALSYWMLFVAVLVGGQIGSRLGSTLLPEDWIRRVTGVLILYVGLRVLFRLAGAG